MHHRFLKTLVLCTVLMSQTACAADDKTNLASENNTTASAFENFQQIQLIIRDTYCPETKHRRLQKELIEISKNDRADRTSPNPDMTSNDTKRRVRVAEIAAEACLKDKNDYFTAAVVFQHGSLPEHYMQAIIYANKAMELGHPVVKPLRLAAIDRYLMSLGHKQIFGSQVTAPAAYKEFENEKDTIPCLWPIEDSIDLVKDYNFGSQEYRIELRETITAKKQQLFECDFPARDSSAMLAALLNTKI